MTQLAALEGPQPEAIIPSLLGPERCAKLALPRASLNAETEAALDSAPGGTSKKKSELQSLWAKLRTIAEDARTYEQDTGVQALFVGYPLLHLPPASRELGGAFGAKRILAPIAFIPVQLALKTTRPPSVTLEAVADGVDLVVPNAALLAWIQQATGQRIGEVFADEEGTDPWREINELVGAVARALDISAPAPFGPTSALSATPRSDSEDAREPSVLSSAVLGLFPVSNQGLLRDVEALADGEPVVGPLASFLQSGSELGVRADMDARAFDVASERCVSSADPCQLRAVRLARKAAGLVVHGPPGTGKSQTITNIIADHLAHGERVLFVCDKRTALDVVHYRLDHLGLGPLCAVVHDARRDPRELYRSIREQLDNLSESKSDTTAERALGSADQELRQLHAELSDYAKALHDRSEGGSLPSFHELVGDWYSIQVPSELSSSELHDLDATSQSLERDVQEVLQRGLKEEFPTNPWTHALGIQLREYLARPHEHWMTKLRNLSAAAERADATLTDDVFPLNPALDIAEQGATRAAFAATLERVVERSCESELARWISAERRERDQCRDELESVQPMVPAVESQPLDRELFSIVAAAEPGLQDVVLWVAKLASYLQIATRWYRFIFFGRRGAAAKIVERFGLSLDAATAQRVRSFLDGLRTRRAIQNWCANVMQGVASKLLPDRELTKMVGDHVEVFRVLAALDDPRTRTALPETTSQRIQDASSQRKLVASLRASAVRAEAIAALRRALDETGLLNEPARRAMLEAACEGGRVAGDVGGLLRAQPSIEGLLRIRERLTSMPVGLQTMLEGLLVQSISPEIGWAAVRKAALAGEIVKRIAATPQFHDLDGDRLRATYEHYRKVEAQRRTLARDAILHRWTVRQRERLLATTGSRLNGAGAEVRRRLVMRGERAMKLRQVIAAGVSIEGGDPLFDLRPVWMASPEVVAQIFPRLPVFDVVVFDEASQCRLEEALPVLTRAKRVVIAGDPQQLPPTRFFESAVTQSQEAETETEQALFEEQQAEIEDLLGAALNLAIEQSYLDVHYRSNNSDLIQFSNGNFYDARLQAIPGHPKNWAKLPPLQITHAAGVYDKRANPKEAQEVVRIVKRLLAQPNPPSIGIACFNLTQRDAIVEALDRAASEDNEFAAQLASARTRRGAASFEGLFVKNLENVQGDERDHLIISTTYGPDPSGRFYRRFGPLAQAGGGRRLNVLVTRARREVHIVTSIPAAVYRLLPPIEAGKKPNGAWLLFSYLNYAEHLEQEYAKEDDRRRAVAAQRPDSLVHDTRTPSAFAIALGRHLSEAHGVANEVHWGNSGFAVDAALVHPTRPEDVTLGVLCDATRFDNAPDRVQWEVFRTEVLEAQGWKFHRIWTPQFFRDPKGAIAAILAEVQMFLRREGQPAADTQQTRARDVTMN